MRPSVVERKCSRTACPSMRGEHPHADIWGARYCTACARAINAGAGKVLVPINDEQATDVLRWKHDQGLTRFEDLLTLASRIFPEDTYEVARFVHLVKNEAASETAPEYDVECHPIRPAIDISSIKEIKFK